jgi:hypothetical protein
MVKFMIGGLLAASLTASTTAQAQKGPYRGAPSEERACRGDAHRHCRAVLDQGDMAVLACLQQQRSKLSRACQAVLGKHGQ